MTTFRPLQAFLCLSDIRHQWAETRIGYQCSYCNKFTSRLPEDTEDD